ncbi:MAG: FAD-binding oxidoreductase [Thermomicrobiales bacterium]
MAPRFTRRALAAGALAAPFARHADSLAAQPALTGQPAWPGDPLYEETRWVFNARFAPAPAGIVFCFETADVQNALAWAAAQGLPVCVRSGGHSYEGYSALDGHLVIDLSEMDAIALDAAGNAVIGPGARMAGLYATLAEQGVTIAGGTCPGVGLGGLALGGGIGFRARRDGLTCDTLLAAEVVLADGRVVTVSATEQPDLFWALRGGGGGNVGVVTSLTLRTTPAEDVAMASIVWPWDEAPAVIAAWQDWAPFTDDRLTSSLAFFRPDSGVIGFTGVLLGGVAELEQLLWPMLAVGSPSPVLRALTWAEAAVDLAGPNAPHATFKNASAFAARPLSPEAIAIAVAQMAAAPAPSNLVSFFSLGGAIATVPPGATAYPHRRALFDIQYQAYWQEAWEAEANIAWIDGFRAALAPYTSGAYVNYVDADLPDWAVAYYGRNLNRLMRVKARYDPGNVFGGPQRVPGTG